MMLVALCKAVLKVPIPHNPGCSGRDLSISTDQGHEANKVFPLEGGGDGIMDPADRLHV